MFRPHCQLITKEISVWVVRLRVSSVFLGLVLALGSVVFKDKAIATTMSRQTATNDIIQSNESLGRRSSQVSSDLFLLSQRRSEPEIQQGDSGPLVEALQNRLADLGYYSGPMTGYFGEMTQIAIIRFQRDQGLTADGIVGAGTANALRRSGEATFRPNNPLTLEVGDQGPAIETLQNQLATLGYYDGPITGYFGPLTEAALQDFQSVQGLAADGVVGTATQSALDRALQGRSTPQSALRVANVLGEREGPDPNDGVWETGESGPNVSLIQRQLQVLGYYRDNIDGDFGEQTEAAVLAFQRSQSLTTDGKVGPVTTGALDTAVRASSRPATSSSLSSVSPSAQSPASTVATSSRSESVAGSETSISDANRVSDLPPIASNETSAGVLSNRQASIVPENVGGTASPLVTIGDQNVLEIQRRLRDQGIYSGDLDGKLGPATQRAIRAAQRQYGLGGDDFDF